VGSRAAIELLVIVGVSFRFYNKDLVLIEASSGGGKCPEEERTTCSGGPVSSGYDANATA
jgi:hypothetical protein